MPFYGNLVTKSQYFDYNLKAFLDTPKKKTCTCNQMTVQFGTFGGFEHECISDIDNMVMLVDFNKYIMITKMKRIYRHDHLGFESNLIGH